MQLGPGQVPRFFAGAHPSRRPDDEKGKFTGDVYLQRIRRAVGPNDPLTADHQASSEEDRPGHFHGVIPATREPSVVRPAALTRRRLHCHLLAPARALELDFDRVTSLQGGAQDRKRPVAERFAGDLNQHIAGAQPGPLPGPAG